MVQKRIGQICFVSEFGSSLTKNFFIQTAGICKSDPKPNVSVQCDERFATGRGSNNVPRRSYNRRFSQASTIFRNPCMLLGSSNNYIIPFNVDRKFLERTWRRAGNVLSR